MQRIKAALQHLSDRLTYRQGDLQKSRRRAKHFRERAELDHGRQATYLQRAAAARRQANMGAYGNPHFAEAQRLERRAARCGKRAERSHKKATFWKGRIKTDVAAVENLNERVGKRQDELGEWMKTHGVQFVGPNKVVGGTPHQRLRAAQLRACKNYREGKLPGYYSQEGAARAYDHTLYRYPYGHIWDCSTYGDGVYICCGLEAPSGPRTEEIGGYTGTQGEHGKQIPESEAKPGDLVLYGAFPHHHVEVVLDPNEKLTTGHGSPPVDPGVFDLFGDGDYIIRTYV